MNFRLSLFGALAVALALSAGLSPSNNAQAQNNPATVPAAGTTPVIAGATLDKKAFQLAALKGKVVLVMFWSTDCAVCRDKMPELRENVQGWADKPFELVMVSVDRRRSDLDSYNAIVNKLIASKQRFTQLWAGESGYSDNLLGADTQRSQLPTTFLINKQGKLVERYNGRIPAEVWDKIADLL